MYKYILYIYKELFFVLILKDVPAHLENWSLSLFLKNSYLLNAVSYIEFLNFHRAEVEKYFCFQGKMI